MISGHAPCARYGSRATGFQRSRRVENRRENHRTTTRTARRRFARYATRPRPLRSAASARSRALNDADAEALRRCLTILDAAVGSEHPNTVACRANYTAFLRDIGQLRATTIDEENHKGKLDHR